MSNWVDGIINGLNQQQQIAVKHVDGPLLVIAGAGSGKTRVLTNRIAYLIDQGILANNILAVTFTNKAAKEMETRVESILSKSDIELNSKPLIGTFHAVCLRFLRSYIHLIGYENSFVIYDTADQEALMKIIIKDLEVTGKAYTPRAILSKISNAKNHLISAEEFKAKAHNQFMMTAANCYKQYQHRLKISQALDFDDIIMRTILLFKQHPEILEKYQDRFKYIMIDEYQDTNYAQHVLVDLLSRKYKNLMVVGDVDQSIYGFRGANASNILDFNKTFPATKVVKLEMNYRSTQNILKAAHHIIEKNQNRHEKEMKTTKEGGDKVRIMGLGTMRDEAVKIAIEVSNIKSKYLEYTYNDFAVLYRTNAQSRIMEEAFIRYGIPYRIIGGVKFYSRKEIKDVVSYLRVIQNSHDVVSLMRIINTPSRKIGAKTIEIIKNAADQVGMSFFEAMSGVDGISDLPDSKKRAVKSFVELIDHLKVKAKEYNVAGLLKYLLVETGYKEYLLENSEVKSSKDSLGDGQSRLENVYELISVASKYNELEPMVSLSTFLEEVSLIAEVDNIDESENAVVLMTIHSAKGLEFSNVFVSGLEEGLFPHFNSLTSPEGMEEERRLMYVAITRAKERLYLSFAKTRMFYGDTRNSLPSQFLKDIPEEYLIGDITKLNNRHSNVFDGYAERVENYYSSSREVTSLSQKHINTDTYEDSDISIQLKVGDKVTHKLWQEGVVTAVRGGVVEIRFNKVSVGTKTLALNIAPITKIS